ncbi:1,2-dihydroxy-3-keto-5-methylthiopentene dioxygenase [Pseudoalteromonas piscicida]|uniref:Acireductone dioxygenase n=1 Tax=Pseudoalteromonas piscicida TaxID=43662 RepID=A0ABN5CLV3_PSEO7|nr:cupin domain-containing protein [Pseudoalteromonas piscicida]ATD08187.1 1,2-dihydroxy-3-keto-5-methylthiopentene dioxygenase [Pseudoalteromonas piscicida]MDP4490127.1 cupin domain-containing protein [Pseudoalteromonas piscicida]WPU30243.1 cupin domain-containing protein [Pseudoalteromonas piscicida]|tara:strand:- start:420 stop:962 length:543 start_codon:yes stop_codon:yes gene_type:complete
MSQLTIYQVQNPSQALQQEQDANIIASLLAELGVRFEQWQANTDITAEMSQDDIINAYQSDIERLKAQGGYQTVDVISLAKGNPSASELRQKFLFEHTHSEDEVRFFVKGQGLFCLHLNDKVYQVLCQQGDLISVPENTPHWFDMGSDPEFTAIRLFNNQEGWVAKSTDSEIAKQFPLLD